MAELLEITVQTGSGARGYNFGEDGLTGKIVAKGRCPFCHHQASFRQIESGKRSSETGYTVPVKCDTCDSFLSISKESGQSAKIYPPVGAEGLDGIPEDIDRYYQEALRCISADAPSGAATLFRKTIHAISIHYRLTEVDDEKGIPSMIREMDDEDILTGDLAENLSEVKELGNDGAHINENEPTMDQVLIIKDLIDAVLSATVKSQQLVESARERRETSGQENNSPG